MNTRTDIVAVVAMLTAARAIVTDPARWCACPHALDPDGLKCEGRASYAARWGALGALDRAGVDASAAQDSIGRATWLLNEGARKVSKGGLATAYVLNENAGHAATVAMFDRALDAAPKPPPPSAVDVLVTARTLIAHPGRWTRRAVARNALGRAVHIDDDVACRFCAAGAVAAGRALSMDFADRERWNDVMGAVDSWLDCAAFELADHGSYIRMNEREDHPRVVATLVIHSLDDGRSSQAGASAFDAVSKSNVDCTRGRGPRSPFCALQGGGCDASMPAAPPGPAPTRFGRQRYRTGIVARRSAEDLAPFRALENAAHDATQGHSGRLAD